MQKLVPCQAFQILTLLSLEVLAGGEHALLRPHLDVKAADACQGGGRTALQLQQAAAGVGPPGTTGTTTVVVDVC